MKENLQSIRGMNDILPENSAMWRYIETKLAALVHAYGYQELRAPLVESTHLFKRSIGEVTDVIEKEMYTFTDNGGDSISLRPEMTAGMTRAVIQHNLAARSKIKCWNIGQAFRYERPQKGRFRQFHQFDIEAFGYEGPDIDAEIIALTAQIWHEFSLQDMVSLEINSIGTLEERMAYREGLLTFLEPLHDQLDAHSQVRLYKNPMRILDSKDENTQKIVKNAPLLEDYLGEESKQHFSQLQSLLTTLGISFTVNPYLVRGLDYYSKTVFEWVTDKLGAQSAVCAGGRYDGLVEQLGGKPTPGIGCAMGIERFIELVKLSNHQVPEMFVDVYIIVNDDASMPLALKVAQTLRYAEIATVVNLGGGSMKSQFKKADNSGAKVAIIIGEDERETEQLSLKYLRDKEKPQVKVALNEVVNAIKN